MELIPKVLTELVILPHWKLLVMMAITIISAVTGLVCLLFAMQSKAEVNDKEIEIVHLYTENNKLRTELSLMQEEIRC